MRKPLLAILLLMSFASMLLLAQTTSNPPQPPTPAMRAQHRVQFLTTALSLTAAQQQQATTIFTNAATAEDAVHSSMKTAHQSLQDAIKANDTAAIDQAAATVGNLTAQLTSIDAKAHASLYQLLTADQQTKFSQMHAGGPNHFFVMGGPGGPFQGGMAGPPPQP